MHPDECYAFDLHGFLVIEDAIDPAVLAAIQPIVDQHQAAVGLGPELSCARIDSILTRDPRFLDLAMSPRVLARVVHLIRDPRLKSTWLDFKAQGGGIGYHSNHTPYNPVDAYHWQGAIYANLVTVCYALCDIPVEGGALDVIPGSHKANYPLPEDPAVLASLRRKLPLKQGSALIFSHDVNHGSHNRLDYVRRCLFTSFSTGSSAAALSDRRPVVLAGTSMGGRGAYELAYDHSRHLAGLIVIAAFGLPPLAPRLHALPTWIAHGSEDELVPVAQARTMAAALPRAQYRELAGRGHACTSEALDDPGLWRWIDRVKDSPPPTGPARDAASLRAP